MSSRPGAETGGKGAESNLPVRFGRNVLSNYGTALGLLVVALVTTPLLAHALGAERYGVWALVGATVPYLELLELGLAASAVTFVAARVAEGDESGVAKAVNTAFFTLLVPGAVAVGIAVVLAIVLPSVAHIPPHLVGQSRVLLLLMALDLTVSIPGDTFGGALIALQRFDLLNASLVVVMALQAVAWVLVVHHGGGLIDLGVVTVSISLAGQVSRFVLIRRILPWLTISPRLVDRGLIRSMSRVSGWFSLKEAADALALTCDVVIASIVVGLPAAGVYAVAQRLSSLGSGLLSPAVQVFFPHAASRRGEPQRLRETMLVGSRVATGLAFPVNLVLVVFAGSALRAWAGPGFVHARAVVMLLAASTAVTSLVTAGRTIIIGVGQPKQTALVSAGGTATHVALAVVLGRWLGIDGVALGALAATVLFDGTVMLRLVCRHFDLRVLRYLESVVRSHLLPAVVAGALGAAVVAGWLGHVVDGRGRLAGLALVTSFGLGVFALYVAIFLRTGITRQERRVALARIRRMAHPVGP